MTDNVGVEFLALLVVSAFVIVGWMAGYLRGYNKGLNEMWDEHYAEVARQMRVQELADLVLPEER